MATAAVTKKAPEVKESLPTPLRRRNASPAPVVAAATASGAAVPVTASGKTATTGSQPVQTPTSFFQRKSVRYLGPLLLLAGLCFQLPPPRVATTPPQTNISTASPKGAGVSTPSLLDRVANALACPAPREDILDILVGAPYEFGSKGGADSAKTLVSPVRLSELVDQVTKEQPRSEVTFAETELQEAVLQIAATGAGWPEVLRRRILAAMDGPCKVKCSGEGATVTANAIALEVDGDHTSSGTVSLSSGWLHQTVLNLGAATGLSIFKKRADFYKSRPATVVVSSEPIKPRDCLALRGNATVALHVAGASSSAVVRQIVIEQMPHWLAPQLRSLPGHFDVWGEPAAPAPGRSQDSDPYNVYLGSFKYAAAAPAAQAFDLANEVPLRGVRLSFKDNSRRDSDDYFCIYRMRAFESKSPSCVEATGKSRARLAVRV